MLARRVAPAVLAAAGIAGSLAPVNANACTLPNCAGGAAAPASGAVIPRNTPALVVVRAADGAGTPQPTDVTLRVADGGEVPFTTSEHPTDGRSLLVHPSRLETGTAYVLAYSEACPAFGAPTNDAGFVEVPFHAGGSSGDYRARSARSSPRSSTTSPTLSTSNWGRPSASGASSP